MNEGQKLVKKTLDITNQTLKENNFIIAKDYFRTIKDLSNEKIQCFHI